jgi:hypothetical protein
MATKEPNFLFFWQLNISDQFAHYLKKMEKIYDE